MTKQSRNVLHEERSGRAPRRFRPRDDLSGCSTAHALPASRGMHHACGSRYPSKCLIVPFFLQFLQCALQAGAAEIREVMPLTISYLPPRQDARIAVEHALWVCRSCRRTGCPC